MIDTVIKWENNPSELAFKYPLDAIPLGSQLVVYPAQTAIFVKGDEICDVFTSGTYTIKSENVPLLNKLINLPFGGQSPFQAEVWFINQTAILDCKFGTIAPLQIEDPQYHIVVPIRAYGQYGIRINDATLFLKTLVGNMGLFSTDKVKDYLRGIINRKLGSLTTQKLYQDSISIVSIASYVDEISEYVKNSLSDAFGDYGLELLRFDVMAISPDENDVSFRRLKEAKDTLAKINIMSQSNYQMERSFNVLDTAAANSGGGIIGSAVGIGAGLAVGQQVGAMANNQLNINPETKDYYLAIGGVQKGAFSYSQIVDYLNNRFIDGTTLAWKNGMTTWIPISSLPEFANISGNNTPPIPNIPPIP